jgi:hypothetical protein
MTLKINHSINFSDPTNKEVYTNTIERACIGLKEYMPTSLKAYAYDEHFKCFYCTKNL